MLNKFHENFKCKTLKTNLREFNMLSGLRSTFSRNPSSAYKFIIANLLRSLFAVAIRLDHLSASKDHNRRPESSPSCDLIWYTRGQEEMGSLAMRDGRIHAWNALDDGVPEIVGTIPRLFIVTLRGATNSACTPETWRVRRTIAPSRDIYLRQTGSRPWYRI